MGTNYYLHDREPCPHCGREFPGKHIGKSSYGWCFGLHVIPEDGINTLDDWRREWSRPGAYIVDEYGERASVAEMETIITRRKGRVEWGDDRAFAGYESEEHFHRSNNSARGPNGLVRHRIDGRHCIGHGEGTWDYIAGEFS